MTLPPEQIPMVVAAVSSTVAALSGVATWVLTTMRGHDRRLEAEARERMQREEHEFRKWSYEHVGRVEAKQDEIVRTLTPLSVQPLKGNE